MCMPICTSAHVNMNMNMRMRMYTGVSVDTCMNMHVCTRVRPREEHTRPTRYNLTEQAKVHGGSRALCFPEQNDDDE